MKNFYNSTSKQNSFRCKYNKLAAFFAYVFFGCLLLIVIPPSTFAQTEAVRNIPDVNHALQQDSNSLAIPNSDTLVIPALGEHAPAPGDPDFTSKKEAWVINYPDEYQAFINRGNDSVAGHEEPVLDKNEIGTDIEYNESELMEAKLDYLQQHDTIAYEQYLLELESNRVNDSLSKAGKETPEIKTPEKAAEHAPMYGDPDYATKKEEWIKKYPDEYNAVNGSTSEADFESRQNFLESVKDTERDLYLEELKDLKKVRLSSITGI